VSHLFNKIEQNNIAKLPLQVHYNNALPESTVEVRLEIYPKR